MNKKPKNYIEVPELSLEKAQEAFNARNDIIADLQKNKEYKELVEEVYLLIVSKAEQSEELDTKKMQAYIKSVIFKCKASDIVRDTIGVEEMQLEQAIQKYGLEAKKDK